MLYSIVVNFRAQADAVVSPTRGYHAYALFLDMLRQANARVAQDLHDLQGPKPFTLSPLEGRFRRSASGFKLTAGETYWIRLTFLKEDIFAYSLDALLKASARTLRLDQAQLQIHEVITTPGMSPLCDCHEFENIVSQARADRLIHLKFFSPTVFRSGGRRNVLFPEPRLLFNSLLPKWQAFSPISLGNNLAALAEKATRIAKYKLETRILHFGTYQEIGFEGKCTIEIAEEVPEQAVRSLNALGDFAFYSGAGAKTSMGMGQTRRLKNVESQKSKSSEGD